MSTVYVVRPDERGVYTYNSWCIEHSWTTPPRLDVFSAEQPFLPPAVQRCTVRPNSVCEHGWFCTDNHKVAVMVDKLRGERAAVVAWLRAVGEPRSRSYRMFTVCETAGEIERGEHRREEKR